MALDSRILLSKRRKGPRNRSQKQVPETGPRDRKRSQRQVPGTGPRKSPPCPGMLRPCPEILRLCPEMIGFPSGDHTRWHLCPEMHLHPDTYAPLSRPPEYSTLAALGIPVEAPTGNDIALDTATSRIQTHLRQLASASLTAAERVHLRLALWVPRPGPYCSRHLVNEYVPHVARSSTTSVYVLHLAHIRMLTFLVTSDAHKHCYLSIRS
jgi:hypothetical protein